MEVKSIILLIVAVVLLLILLLSIRQRKKLIDADQKLKDNLGILKQIESLRLQRPLPEDQHALDLIKSKVKKVKWKPSLKTSVKPKKIYQMSSHLIKDIAKIYYPESLQPEYEASISDLLKLNERIVVRLKNTFEEIPLLKQVKDLRIQTILKTKRYIDDKKSKIKKIQSGYKILQYGYMVYRSLSTRYWATKLLGISTREALYRMLLSQIIFIVGEEAMSLYGRSDIKSKELMFEKDTALGMIDKALSDEVITNDQYEIILNYVLNETKLNDLTKVNILKALSLKKQTKHNVDFSEYTDSQKEKLLFHVTQIADASEVYDDNKLETLKKMKFIAEKTLNSHDQIEHNEALGKNKKGILNKIYDIFRKNPKK